MSGSSAFDRVVRAGRLVHLFDRTKVHYNYSHMTVVCTLNRSASCTEDAGRVDCDSTSGADRSDGMRCMAYILVLVSDR